MNILALVIAFVVAVVVAVGIALLPAPWDLFAQFLLMAGIAAFVFVQERRTGRSGGLIKWLAVGLAVFYLWRLVAFFN